MRVISGKAKGTKLGTIEEQSTRPTLDRVKESLFNIINTKIEDSIVLDLFAGSGALGIECISRGAKQVYFCDKSKQAINQIKQNLIKTRFEQQAVIFQNDYINCLKECAQKQIVFDLIFLDPPYANDLIRKLYK